MESPMAGERGDKKVSHIPPARPAQLACLLCPSSNRRHCRLASWKVAEVCLLGPLNGLFRQLQWVRRLISLHVGRVTTSVAQLGAWHTISLRARV